MKEGDDIFGYTLTSPGSSAGGGRSMWAFADKGGESYFVKRFLTPKYPVEGSPGSPANKATALKRCEAFEIRNRRILDAIIKKIGRGGSIVAPITFNRVGPTYYKVYDRIDVSGLSPKQISDLPNSQKNLILRVVAHSVSILHHETIIHGDLKPDNILIKRSDLGTFTAKLIDFDDSYFAAEVPDDPEAIVGDPAYYSPELLNYVRLGGADIAARIETKSDIYAMGLVFHQYITGVLPDFDRKHFDSAAAFSLLGRGFLDEDVKGCGALSPLIASMLHSDPLKRPASSEILAALRVFGSAAHGRITDGRSSVAKTAVDTTGAPRLKIKEPSRAASNYPPLRQAAF